jgi:hypothetical protein
MPVIVASKRSPGATGTTGPSAPDSTISPARSGLPSRCAVRASQATARSGSPRHAAPEPVDTTPPPRLIVRGAIGLATEGFFEGVADGRIVVRRDRTIVRLLARDGTPHAELSDGTVLPADLVVCATGFTQGVPFLPGDVRDRLHDERGNFLLYRQILPLGVPGLYFNGYNSSFFSPLNAEMAAVWIAADLAGAVPLPDPAAMREAVVEQVAFMDTATDRHHCRGTKIIPFSMHNVDEVLDDLDLNIKARVRAAHWLNPINPAAYRRVTPTLVDRLRAGSPGSPDIPAARGGGAAAVPTAVPADVPTDVPADQARTP